MTAARLYTGNTVVFALSVMNDFTHQDNLYNHCNPCIFATRINFYLHKTSDALILLWSS
jgi:hypothetical protein